MLSATFKFGLEIFTTIILSFLAIFQCIKKLFDCLSLEGPTYIYLSFIFLEG